MHQKSHQTGKKTGAKNAQSRQPGMKRVSTKIFDDVITDEVSLFKPHFKADYAAYLNRLWESGPEIHTILLNARELDEARDFLYRFLEREERKVFDLDNDLHILEKSTVRECIRVFRSILGPINEFRTGFSALESLWKLAQNRTDELKSNLSPAFLMEFINLFRGISGKTGIYAADSTIRKGIPEFLKQTGRKAAVTRMEILDELGSTMLKYFRKYPSGLEEEIIGWRKENKQRILRYFHGDENNWNDYHWQLRNVIRDLNPLNELIELSTSQKEAIEKAVQNKIAFGITPYYLSLMDSKLSIGYDHAVRAQVIPPANYIEKMTEMRKQKSYTLDFMGEHDTSPVDLVTRRYPGIAILKPYNTCAQICVYCQRNWEIDSVLEPGALASEEELAKALSWFDRHKSVGDVLITGGDPLIMTDARLERLLTALAGKKQIFRIRIGTRTPVVLPMRITDDLIEMVSAFHQPPTREIAIVTHFEHSYEITPDAMKAVQKFRKAGISVYNQQVFTVENSRKFETARLRHDLRSVGIDPYYTFNMKGKEETRSYMVPIARILQERKEEARLLPGLDRTDEPVFNVPRLGKNHLQAGQDRRLVMILSDGSRVYEFHPWEKNITPLPPYNYVDVPIYEYLEELARRGENVNAYRTIWYYY
jgi:lysine 2,3-aminomutase